MKSTSRKQISEGSAAERKALPLKAFRLPGIPAGLVPAQADRPWMNAFGTAFANRCLPMRIANQDGWFVLNSCAIQVTWNGGAHQKDISIEILDGLTTPVLSHFGHGVITWWIPYLFRTPPGYNMHVRGPVNFCKDGISPLSAIVETDWAVASFPMSWKITRAGHPIRFERDEPICMISPVLRGSTESFVPELLPIETDAYSAAGHEGWSRSRKTHNESLRHPDPPKKWEKHYFVGIHPGTTEAFQEHQVRLQVKPFAGVEKMRLERDPRETELVTMLRSGCPFPHEESARTSVKAEAARLQTPAAEVLRERGFFARMPELLEHAAAWSGIARVRTDIARPAWAYEHVPSMQMLLSCAPESVFPADLVVELKERLMLWCGLHGMGPLESLQLSLFVNDCFRKEIRPRQGSYFALPLTTAKKSRSKGGRLTLLTHEPFRMTLKRLAVKRFSPEENCLLAFPQQAHVGVEKVTGSMNPEEGLLLLEGTFGAKATTTPPL
jgi:hypothetical protein